MLEIVNADCLEFLARCRKDKYQMIFADPPDNIGLKYNSHKDSVDENIYYSHLSQLINAAIRRTPTFWLSYYWKHDVPIKHIIYKLQQMHYPKLQVKTFIWRFTFGQHNKWDCGSGFRFLVRMQHGNYRLNPKEIMEMSERQRMDDPRANPDGRVPDDVWEFPRVVGNAYERRRWHPTQHPEALMQRIIEFCTDLDDNILDLYSGTGTTLRAAMKLNRNCTGVESDPIYCQNIKTELLLKEIIM